MRQITYTGKPIEGYDDGLVIPDGAYVYQAGGNLWITDDERKIHFNVHPYRDDLGGYPVRWIQVDDDICGMRYINSEDAAEHFNP